ncbi:MAG: oleate hydratase [Nevskia sp.]|nr:oleate hydratase [Nevskia sp.]
MEQSLPPEARLPSDPAAGTPAPGRTATIAYFVGGGIASLAGAAFLIRDGGWNGGHIVILEETSVLGGSLDGAGSAETGYVIRGGRMFADETYTCTYDLLSSIPSVDNPHKTVREEIRRFNRQHPTASRCRLVRAGEKIDASKMGLDNRDRLDLTEVLGLSEHALGSKRIEDHFQPAFFKTNFWSMWGTMFAFQPWHSLVEFKRYLHRFFQEFPRIDTLGGVRRTRYNQFDSIVLPLSRWLQQQGVRFLTGCRVTDLDFRRGLDGKAVERIRYTRDGAPGAITVADADYVFVTLGSMTAASSLGSMTTAPGLDTRDPGAAWTLWETLARANPEFGRPAAFNGDVAGSKWLSFTATLRDPLFFELMEKFSGNPAGTGGLVTFTDSRWLMSIVLAHQPHFLNQPKDVQVFWGYGLFPDEEGNFVHKKMSDCSGAEILTELLHHLRFDAHLAAILQAANCIPCMMPYITSQFMPRAPGDRPPVVPAGTRHLAFIGQFCEMPDDVVFTVEYSVRSAQTAVYSLLGLERPLPPIYRGQHDLRMMVDAVKTMLH